MSSPCPTTNLLAGDEPRELKLQRDEKNSGFRLCEGGKLTGCEARIDGGGGLSGTQAAVASHVLLFLAIGDGRGRVSLVVLATGRDLCGAGAIPGGIIKFLRHHVDLREHNVFHRLHDAQLPSLAARGGGWGGGRVWCGGS